MLAIPLIRIEDDSKLTPIERTTLACEQVITALVMQGPLSDPAVSAEERETFTTLSVASTIPAEA